ncbi:hypothetical protein MPH47_14285 [Psychrobacillus psychrodurans]|uniref:hypothetical protein n=1 Tax=Psychrobacillus TaxID=1221880 RepID=UPI001F4D81E9|nr:hypothetical protein [Psychrobacillus psychrodurans]MCK1998368.1 hypothetical protein [Psychrobacillus psychrodurans]
MPEDYEKGSSKSFAAYEYTSGKEIKDLPCGLLVIVSFAYNIPVENELNHDNEILLGYYNWDVLNNAKEEWLPEPEKNILLQLINKTIWRTL